MFPQTYHVETVVRLTRETPLAPEVASPGVQPEMEPFRLQKPVEPASLNISANFNAFKEKTGDLFQAFGQQLGAAFGLGLSIGATLFAWVKRCCGLAGAADRFSGRAAGLSDAPENLNRSIPPPHGRVGTARREETSVGHQAFRSIREQSALLTLKIRSAFQRKPNSPSLPPEPETPISVETSPFPAIGSAYGTRRPRGMGEKELSPVMEEVLSPLAPSAQRAQATLPPLFTETAAPVESPFPQTKPGWKLPTLPNPAEETRRWFRGRTPFRWALTAALSCRRRASREGHASSPIQENGPLGSHGFTDDPRRHRSHAHPELFKV